MTSPDPRAALADELLPCPFCGGKAEIERRGTAKQSCIIACDNCGCRLETGEIWSMGERWNTRSPSPYSRATEKPVADELAKALLMNMFAHDTQLIEGWKSKSDVKWLVALGFVTDEVLPYRSSFSYSGTERYCPICDSPAVGSNGYCNGHQDLAPSTLPRDAERETIERCAQIADDIENQAEKEMASLSFEPRYGMSMRSQAATDIAAAIRALPSIPSREGPLQSTTEQADASRDHPVREDVARALYEIQPIEDRLDGDGKPISWQALASFCKELHYNQADAVLALLPPRREGVEREALKAAREEIVLTIAFLGRDAGTARLSGTVEGLIKRLAAADKAILRALSPSPTSVMPDEGKQK